MQAIHTRYIPATNFRSTRIVAEAAAGKVVVAYDDELNESQNHRAAAEKLARSKGWLDKGRPFNRLVSGGLRDGSEVHVFCDSHGRCFNA